VGKLFRFERMITPFIIQVIFWVGVIGSIFGGIFMMIGNGGFGGVLIGLVVMLIGPIAIRIYCEILIVAFKMLSLLVDVRDRLT